MASAPAKLLIFPRKTLAARYVVPSASRGWRQGRGEIKIHAATRLFSAAGLAGCMRRPAGRNARDEGHRRTSSREYQRKRKWNG